jgi:hypothetical protein
VAELGAGGGVALAGGDDIAGAPVQAPISRRATVSRAALS